jgi:hypothetical protein
MKTCSVCKRELPVNRQRFCSDICSYRNKIAFAKRRRVLYQLDPIDCATCGKTFTPKTSRQSYCHKHCWTVEQVRRRNAKRKLVAREPKVRRAERFMPSWNGPSFGERLVTEAEFTKADSSERFEMQAAVEEYLRSGGKITRYGDQAAKIEVEGEIKWSIEKSEERDIQNELSRIWGVGDVLGN